MGFSSHIIFCMYIFEVLTDLLESILRPFIGSGDEEKKGELN